MSDVTASQALAAHLMVSLLKLGVTQVYISPGARSQALTIAAMQLEKAGLMTTQVRVDERSAGFQALGAALASKRPVAVITTSGTAVANLHPAILEASHAGVPLIALTSDRPMELRGVGANQTTNQIGIFADAVRACVAVEAPPIETAQHYAEEAVVRAITAALGIRTGKPGPVQLNVAFREPLSSSEPNATLIDSLAVLPVVESAEDEILELPAASQTLVLAGAGAGRAAVIAAEAGGWPLLAEPSSGARFGSNAIVNYRFLLDQRPALVSDIKRVVVYGKPTLNRQAIAILYRPEVEITVVRNVAYGFFDVSRRALRFVPAVAPQGEKMAGWLEAWQDAAREVAISKSEDVLDRQGIIKAVWDVTASEDALVLGASRLIRDAENWAPRKNLRIFANRGLAGIDGTLATALGIAKVSDANSTTRVLLGDLAFLHDVGSLVAGSDSLNIQVVVVNDHGGTIFQSLELTKHVEQADFERFFSAGQDFKIPALAEAFGWQYLNPKDDAELHLALGTKGRVIIEVVPN